MRNRRELPRHVNHVFVLIMLATVWSFSLPANASGGEPDHFLKINKSIDIFGRVYREIALNYVDAVDAERLMRAGVDGMLSVLDPYTTFLGEGEGDEIELLTTGKYGGIGITVALRDGYITITSMMEGYAAERQGLRVGDRLLEVEGVSVVGGRPDQVRSLTRGEPGTMVRLKIEREGISKPLEFVLVREEIRIKNISFAEFIEDGIAYVKLDRFSRRAGEEVRATLKELHLQSPIRGLILDLRDNPGGLLDVAVEVASKFLPKGSLIVTTRGRRPETYREFFSQEEPTLPDAPLVLLVNRNSASASEILAGAIQDLDRGIVLGNATFGKGLVQTVTPLPYNSQLKITTAKYYTPSGRSIQQIDYRHKTKDGLFLITPDSMKREFRTAAGRRVYEFGGVMPDTTVQVAEPSALYQELVRKSKFFKFATSYIASREDGHDTIDGDDVLLEKFQTFVRERDFTYQEPGEVALKELREIGVKANFSVETMQVIEALSRRMAEEKERAFERNRNEVLRALRMEIAARDGGQRARIRASLPGDNEVGLALELLRDQNKYSMILAGH